MFPRRPGPQILWATENVGEEAESHLDPVSCELLFEPIGFLATDHALLYGKHPTSPAGNPLDCVLCSKMLRRR